MVPENKPQKLKREKLDVVCFSDETLQKIDEIFKSKDQNEIIQEKNLIYSLQFKKENNKVVAELTNIDNGEVSRLTRKTAKPATLIDFRV